MADSITTGSSSSQQNWLDEVRKAYLRGNILKPFMGTGSDAAIHIENVEGKSGDTVTTHFVRRPPTSARISGATKAKGNEYPYAQTTDNIVLQLERFPLSIENVAESEQRTKVKIREQARSLLPAWMAETLFEDIMDSLLNTTNRSQSRYLYGSDEANFDATEATAKANVDSTDDKLSLDVLAMAKRKAMLGGNFKITPGSVKSDNNMPMESYIGLFHPYQIRDLLAGQDAKNHIFYNNRFEVGSGAFYRGHFEGIALYEIPYDGMLEASAGASNIQIGHGLIMGAGAAKIGYAPVANGERSSDARMSMASESDDFGNDLGICGSEIRGQTKLVFTNPGSSDAEDFGVVNVVTAAVAD